MKNTAQIKEKIKGKRIAAVDYGLKRIGTAVTDELHITINPKKLFLRESKDFPNAFYDFLKQENIGAVVIGIPFHHEKNSSNIIDNIRSFENELKEMTGLDVFEVDESYTSVQAVETMINIGTKKKKRSQKGSKDLIAAALILKQFLSEIENYPMG